MPAYVELFPVGTNVRVAAKDKLEEFRRTWKYHHKLTAEQLEYAGECAIVTSVGFYHGGDVLYNLNEIPGIWHEACLEPAASNSS